MREKVIQEIEERKLIAIVRGVDRDKLVSLAEALYSGGVRLIEVTFPHDNMHNRETAETIELLAREFAGRLLVGAGTVMNKTQLQMTKDAGGLFVISPNTDEQVIREANRLGLVSIPGAFTPTEIQYAHASGADFVKLFPVSGLSPEYVKAVTAPLSGIRLLAVGGVDLTNMQAYLEAGVCGFGIGGSLINKRLIEAGDFTSITELARSHVAAIGGTTKD